MRTLKAKSATGPLWRRLSTVAISLLLAAASIWLLHVDTTRSVSMTAEAPKAHLAAWAAIVFFGGGALVYIILMLLPAYPALRIDSSGVTWLQPYPALQRFPSIGGDVTLSWSDIVGMRILDLSQTAPNARSAILATPVVGIVPRDFDSMQPIQTTALQKRMRGFIFRRFGAMPTPLGLELPVEDLLPLLQRYWAAARGQA